MVDDQLLYLRRNLIQLETRTFYLISVYNFSYIPVSLKFHLIVNLWFKFNFVKDLPHNNPIEMKTTKKSEEDSFWINYNSNIYVTIYFQNEPISVAAKNPQNMKKKSR